MADDAGPGAMLLTVGATPRATPLGTRDRLLVAEDGLPTLLESLRLAGIEEAIVIATCERTEIYALTAEARRTTASVTRVLAEHGAFTAEELAGQLQVLEGEHAIRHLFTLAASLDSLVVGEPNILGQIKAGWRLAKTAGMVGSGLDAYLQAAFATAKKVRSRTALGAGPASLAAAAVEVARTVHGRLPQSRTLLVGWGEMAELAVQALIAAGVRQIVVTDPLAVRAAHTAEALDCHIVAFEGRAAALADADIVITSLGTRRFVITPADVRSALPRRRHRPMVFFDCAVPGDIDPAIDGIEEVFRYDLDDLERLARNGHASRREDAARALTLIEADIRAFADGLKERDAIAAVVALRRRFEEVREAALADAGGDAEKATRLLINRLLHGPTEALKAVARAKAADAGDLDLLQRCLDRLFQLRIGDTENNE